MDHNPKLGLNLSHLIEGQLVDAASVGIAVSDPNQPGNPVVYVNSAFVQITGYERAEVLGRNCRFLQGVDTDPAAIEKIGMAIKQQCNVTVLLINYRKNQTAFWNELQLSPIKDESGKLLYFVGFQNDVTNRVVMQDSLDFARRRQEEMIEASGDFFWELNSEGVFVFASNKLVRLLGYRPVEILGLPIQKFIAEDELEQQNSQLTEIQSLRKSFANFKIKFVSKNRGPFWVRINGSPRFDNSTHQFVGFIGSGSDVTEEQIHLIETFRLSTLGKVAAEIAHEINNPLMILEGQLRMIEREIKSAVMDQNKILNFVDKGRKMIGRMSRIVASTKAMSKNADSDSCEPVSIFELIEESIELCNAKVLKAQAKIQFQCEPFDLTLECRPIQLSQVMINLINNACDAISGSEIEAGSRWIQIHVKSVQNQIEMTISNSGANCHQAINQALLNPFRSGKSGKQGSGVGLYLVKKILKAHSATIQAEAHSEHTNLKIIIPKFAEKKLSAG